jgi:hypothetical protein
MKHNITPIELPLGLGTVNSIEILVNYSIGDNTTDLIIKFYDGNILLNPSPLLLAVPAEQMSAWDYNFSPIVVWAIQQLNTQLNPN